MSILSLLLGGVSFATSALTPSQWLIPLPDCLPLFVQQESGWQEEKLNGFVSESTLTFTPLHPGEVNFTWKLQCPTRQNFELEWSFPEESFIQDVFEQEGWHAQFINVQMNRVLIEGSGQGNLKLFVPALTTNFSVTVKSTTISPTLSATVPIALTSWKVFSFPFAPVFTEIRSAATTYPPSLADTTALNCHTQGDLLVLKIPSLCLLARSEPIATQEVRKLYGVKNQNISPLSLPEVAIKPTQSGQVVISEIMWAGSYAQGVNLETDQWIELHNNTNERLNLLGSRLRGAKPLGDIIFQSDLFIPPQGFVVVGRERGTKTSLVKDPDKIELLNMPFSGKTLQLISQSGVILDETPSPPWPAGKNDTFAKTRSSMQRAWMDSDGKERSSWGDCSAPIESFRCKEYSRNVWRSNPGENLGTPWNFNVL